MAAGGTASWDDFESDDPELAERVRERLGSHRHAVLATLRADGSPRLSGMEAPVRSGNLWLAMSPESRKVADLRNDRRFALHSAPDAERLPAGDARVEGVAVDADAAQLSEFVAGHRYQIDDESKMALFVAMIHRVVLVRVSHDSLLIESWTPDGGRDTHTQ